MVGLVERLKSQYELWKLEKYTRRRSFISDYQKDSDYYRQYYRDGVYYDSNDDPHHLPPQARTSFHLAKRASRLVKTKSASPMPPPRCSETYNANYER